MIASWASFWIGFGACAGIVAAAAGFFLYTLSRPSQWGRKRDRV